jgi:hypothetical protein
MIYMLAETYRGLHVKYLLWSSDSIKNWHHLEISMNVTNVIFHGTLVIGSRLLKLTARLTHCEANRRILPAVIAKEENICMIS